MPDVVEPGRPQINAFVENVIIGGLETIKSKEFDGTIFLDNKFTDATVIRFEEATEVLTQGNTGVDDVRLKTRNDACFDINSNQGFEPAC